MLVCQLAKVIKPTSSEVSKVTSEPSHIRYCLSSSYGWVPPCTSRHHNLHPAKSGTALWLPSSKYHHHQHPCPCAQVWHPALLSCRRPTLCTQPGSLWSQLGCNSKRSCATNTSWQEKRCIACCSSSCHTSLLSLLPLSGPATHAREGRKSKAVLKPSLSSSLFIHCAKWYAEKLYYLSRGGCYRCSSVVNSNFVPSPVITFSYVNW